jgi:hypothetical protein
LVGEVLEPVCDCVTHFDTITDAVVIAATDAMMKRIAMNVLMADYPCSPLDGGRGFCP